MSSKHRFEYVKGLIDTQEYISRHVKLKKVGLIYRGLCPFHGEKTPSFTVYPAGYNNPKEGPQEHASFNCFGCGAGGDIFEFKKRIDELKSKWDALESLEKELGIEINDDQVVQNYLKEQLIKAKKSKEQVLSLAEINMVCSSVCRNYLIWVKDNFPEFYEEEVKIIDKYYLYFDNFFDEKTAIEAMNLIDDVLNKLFKRKENLKLTS
ncbi:DNA primase [compost metagenome]